MERRQADVGDSSSPSVTACDGEKFNFCGVSTAGTADAAALPASEKVNPAAPNAGTAALATLFRFEACFTVTCRSSIPMESFNSSPAILRARAYRARLHTVTNALFRHSVSIHLDE